MAIQMDYSLVRFEDGTIQVGMQPPVNISAWNLQFQLLRRFGGVSGLITKSAASGFGGGQSGITIMSSGQGTFSVQIRSQDTSGLDPGVYAYGIQRLDSGFQTTLVKGYFNLLPGIQ